MVHLLHLASPGHGEFSREVSDMPIYEYECNDCGNRFEILQGVNEKPDLKCDNCKGGSVRRVLSPGAFVFKGNGFYGTRPKCPRAIPAPGLVAVLQLKKPIDIFLPCVLALSSREC